MELDARACYQALQSRDRRFDGRFFTGVRTTGVYCRPVCPARTPQRANVVFFACAAAAERAGFRACLRCRPEAAPGTPAWSGTSATVARALRLIADGALDDASVEDLAATLGVGARHLRRLFDEQLGASPLAIAETRRVHFARRLLGETDLPIADLALAAGFASVRRFNEVMRDRTGRTPRVLRTERARADRRAHDGVCLRLAYRPPFDWDALLAFLRPRAIPGVEVVGESTYARTLTPDEGGGILDVRNVADAALLEISVSSAATPHLLTIANRARRQFDCGADPLVIASTLSRDRTLARLVTRRPGLRVPGAWDAWELMVRAVLGQQVTVAGATTLAGRLVRAFGTPVPHPRDGLTHLFPSARRIADADIRTIGVPRARAEAVRAVARAMRDGAIALDGGSDLPSAIASLTALRGIGDWTAHYVAMRAFGEPDAFPAGDLALRRAIAQGDATTTTCELLARSEAWRPWRAYAAMHLWASLTERNTRRRR